jgi:hypothetical protein
MRQTDYVFAKELLTQAGVQPAEFVSSWTRVLTVDQAAPSVAWVFNNAGELLRFEPPFRFTSVE